MRHRTEIQIALLIAGMIAWGYGQRAESRMLQYTGLGFFVAATALRFVKKKPPEDDSSPPR